MTTAPLDSGTLDESASDATVRLDDRHLLEGLGRLRWRLDELLRRRPPQLVVDVSGLSRLSSPTLAALLWAQRRCRARGGHIVLRGLNRRCSDMLTRTGVAPLFAEDRVGAQPGQRLDSTRHRRMALVRPSARAQRHLGSARVP